MFWLGLCLGFIIGSFLAILLYASIIISNKADESVKKEREKNE